MKMSTKVTKTHEGFFLVSFVSFVEEIKLDSRLVGSQ